MLGWNFKYACINWNYGKPSVLVKLCLSPVSLHLKNWPWTPSSASVRSTHILIYMKLFPRSNFELFAKMIHIMQIYVNVQFETEIKAVINFADLKMDQSHIMCISLHGDSNFTCIIFPYFNILYLLINLFP